MEPKFMVMDLQTDICVPKFKGWNMDYIIA